VCQGHDAARNDFETDGGGQPGGFRKTRLRVAQRVVSLLAFDMDDEGGTPFGARMAGFARRMFQALSSAGAVSASINWIGPSGITVEIACL
jgi:hypothetical protein